MAEDNNDEGVSDTSYESVFVFSFVFGWSSANVCKIIKAGRLLDSKDERVITKFESICFWIFNAIIYDEKYLSKYWMKVLQMNAILFV